MARRQIRHRPPLCRRWPPAQMRCLLPGTRVASTTVGAFGISARAQAHRGGRGCSVSTSASTRSSRRSSSPARGADGGGPGLRPRGRALPPVRCRPARPAPRRPRRHRCEHPDAAAARRHDGIDIHRADHPDPGRRHHDRTPSPSPPSPGTIARPLEVAPARAAERALEQAGGHADPRLAGARRSARPQSGRHRRPPAPAAASAATGSTAHRERHGGAAPHRSAARAGVPGPEVKIYIDLGDAEPMISGRLRLARAAADRRDRRPGPRHGRAFEGDRAATSALPAGWRVIRVTWRQLVAERPGTA